MDFYIDAEESTPPDTPERRGNVMPTYLFLDTNHGADKITRGLQTSILLFFNKAPVIWHSNRHNDIEVLTFGSGFIALNNDLELIRELRYKLWMFGVPIEGPTNVLCENKDVYKNASTPEYTLIKKYHSVVYHYCR